ncbi:MAG: hypothetical protein IJY36_01865 [Coprobacter sp.]|nr:hypothetical protein [Coprobacter sp.]
MEKSRISKFFTVTDLIICSVWLLLLAHEDINSGLMNPVVLLFPALRIWATFLMQRQSKLMIAPLVMLSLMGMVVFLDRAPGYLLFIEPWLKLLRSGSALFGVELVANADYQDFIIELCEYSLPISLICYAWLVVIPCGVFVYRLCKRQLQPSSLNIWKAIGLCIYIFVVAFVDAVLLSETYKTTLAVAVLALMLILIPVIFYRGNIKGIFNRGEIAYLLTFAMFGIGYVCGIGLELKSAITVCVLPAAFFGLMNWYVRRETTYKDILLIVGASVVFWCAQYTTNMVRVLLLFTSLAMMAIPVIRFAIDTKKSWASAGLYVVVALIMPVFCLGYNPYSVLEASRAWHFDKYGYSQNGLLCVRSGNVGGLRDRYGVILPLEYDRIELLDSSKPYCKVRKNRMWQIYDIERHELVTDECFEEVVLCDEYVYRLKSQNGDKYMSIKWYYNRYADEQSAVISDELPVKKEE